MMTSYFMQWNLFLELVTVKFNTILEMNFDARASEFRKVLDRNDKELFQAKYVAMETAAQRLVYLC